MSTVEERLAKVAEVVGEHTPVYDYRNGHFTMECEACDFILGGVDRDQAKQRFGAHFADILSPLLGEWQAEEEARALRDVAADLYRNHDMPPNKDGRSYSYRNGWWDGVHHAAKVVERAARAAAEPDAGEPA